MSPFDQLRATRENLLKITAGLSAEQLNRIPPGFNNNIIWNLGHVIATMEGLTYGLGGHRTPSGKDFILRYRKGTKPEYSIDQEEVALIRGRLETSVEQLARDVDDLDFSKFREYQTSYGVKLDSINDGLIFNNLHEAMHLGAVIALLKFV